MMKKTGLSLALIALFTLGIGSPSFAQRGRGMNRMYDPKTVETVTGKVDSVGEVSMRGGRYTGIELVLVTVKDTINVHLGPSFFIEKQQTKVVKNDTVQVTGSRITLQGKHVLIASEVKKGDQVLKLRDEQGIPAWGGGRRNR